MQIEIPTESIDISNWPKDEEHPYYPVGTREKELLICPDNARLNYLIPGHRYLFKKSFHRYQDQFWAEIIAYYVGRLIGVPVPPAYPAYNSSTGECAALIEWFTGYPDQQSERFVQGGDIMQRMIKNFDRKKGKQHNFDHVSLYFKLLNKVGYIKEEWIKWWAGAFAFDALIGNTDRHQDNWGWLVKGETKSPEFRIAPLFDNGTSLGHEILPENFKNYKGDRLLNYINRGTHHMKWEISDKKKWGHVTFLKKFCESFPEQRRYILNRVDFNKEEFLVLIEMLTQIIIPIPLSDERADFVSRLTLARKRNLKNTLEI